MIDFHSHILPAIDDGSKDIEETTALLNMLSEQGVTKVVATPHFYADNESVDMFLERRQKAFEQTAEIADAPEILLGAEVRYYNGISHLQDLKKLCVQGTNLLLIEMPSTKWPTSWVNEILTMASGREVRPVLAHIERYIKRQDHDVWEKFLTNRVMLQCNADFFIDFPGRLKAFALLKNYAVHFIGSDSHNLTNRAPRLGEAMDMIRKKMGADFADQMIAFGESWFE